MPKIFDLETNGLLPDVSKIHCLGWKDIETGEKDLSTANPMGGPVGSGLNWAGLLVTDLLIGHNIINYDIEVIRRLCPTAHAIVADRPIFDTQVAAKLLWPDIKDLDFAGLKTGSNFPKHLIGRHSLKAWGYRLGILKGEMPETNDWSEYTSEMGQYCLQDLEVTEALYRKILAKGFDPRAMAVEFKFAQVMRMQETYGFPFDQQAAVELYAKITKEKADLEKKLQAVIPGWWVETKTPEYYDLPFVSEIGLTPSVRRELTLGDLQSWCRQHKVPYNRDRVIVGPPKKKHTAFNPGSHDHIARYLMEKYNWQPIDFGKDGKPCTDEETLEPLPYPEIPDFLLYLMLGKRLGMIAEGKEAWLKNVEKDGRMHGEVNTIGAVSTRVTHARPNMSQVPAVDKPYGKECRALFTASKGHVLVGADASGIQLRALAHYLQPFDGGEYVKAVTQGDIHKVNQVAGRLSTRDKAKTFIYAWLLGAGDEKAGLIAGPTEEEIDEYKQSGRFVNETRNYIKRFQKKPDEITLARICRGKDLKRDFLNALPALKQLKAEVERRAKERGYLLGLDGRRLPIRSAHAAFSSLLQGFEACVMKAATGILHDLVEPLLSSGKVGFCVFAHDEWQLSCDPAIGDAVGAFAVHSIIQAGKTYNVKCPLNGEYRIGANWADTH